ncbi:SDR family oxidoreductase [Arcticibacter sp. MXS-1]|uniref:SDR family oxidoreductase n=1 Tax=Arcticibacter sp. MXS-1 TaxID=3341726 RepID=UPI0035A897D2
MKKGIEGKTVVITGASSGIGEAIAELLASRGARVVLGARRTDRLDVIAERIRENAGEAISMQMDVTKRTDLMKLTALAVEKYGSLDVMINNAGISQLYPMEETDVDAGNR